MTAEELKTALQDQLAEFNADDLTSPAQIVRAIIGTVIDALTVGTNLFTGAMPDEPSFCVTTYDSGGGEQEERHLVDESSVQVRSRGGYNEAYKILREVRLVMQSIPKLILPTDEVLIGVWIASNVAFIGRDSDQKSLFTLNMRLNVEPNQKGNKVFEAVPFPRIVNLTQAEYDALPAPRDANTFYNITDA